MDIVSLLATITVFYGLYLILSLSFNLEYGFAGQPNLGKVFFYSLGAYTAGWFTASYISRAVSLKGGYCSGEAIKALQDYGINHPLSTAGLFIASIILALIIGAVAGYVSSYPALRLTEDFLAITLLAVGEIGRIVARTSSFVCGVTGLTGIPNPLIWLGDPRTMKILYAVLVMVFAGVMYLLAELLANSPFGRILKAVRDDELAAEAMGKDVARAKGVVLMVGSAMAAVAGVLYAFYAQNVIPDDFIPNITFVVIAMTMLGGSANNKGMLAGTLVITLLDQLTNASTLGEMGISVEALPININYIKYMVIGLTIILVLMFRPQGMFPEKPLKTPAVDMARQAVAERNPKLLENTGKRRVKTT